MALWSPAHFTGRNKKQVLRLRCAPLSMTGRGTERIWRFLKCQVTGKLHWESWRLRATMKAHA
jgi:hypothetical protein